MFEQICLFFYLSYVNVSHLSKAFIGYFIIMMIDCAVGKGMVTRTAGQIFAKTFFVSRTAKNLVV